jgi:hypothetical protein
MTPDEVRGLRRQAKSGYIDPGPVTALRVQALCDSWLALLEERNMVERHDVALLLGVRARIRLDELYAKEVSGLRVGLVAAGRELDSLRRERDELRAALGVLVRVLNAYDAGDTYEDAGIEGALRAARAALGADAP